MVFKRTSIKRKRKVDCLSPLLDDSPKRTKVHAQRKFAQGSNVNSPVITPIKELESEIPKTDVLPEPVELLPIKRPNTEDFLTFLCFRGTPILPPSLNFFNTASIVDTNGQVHEIKSESPKNGPIDIAKCGTSSEKPFIAFGVRKRADPIVISRQMDRKRRHALALQALRRKYQEQKMAKIRALTISKLSEKVTNRTLVRTNTISKTETVTKKTNMLQKTKVVATKHVKVTTETLKTTLRPKVKPKMCLRSFRGRFVQKELPFRKRVPEKKIIKKPLVKQVVGKNKKGEIQAYVSEDEEPLSTPIKSVKQRTAAIKIIKKPIIASSDASNSRMTRSGLSNKEMNVRRQQIKKRILLSTPSAIVKPRSLRSTTIKKTVLSQKKNSCLKAKKKLRAQQRVPSLVVKKPLKLLKKDGHKNPEGKKIVTNIKKDSKPLESKKDAVKTIDVKKEVTKSTDIKKLTDIKKVTDIKKESNKVNEKDKKQVNKTIDVKKEVSKSTDINIKKETNKSMDIKRVSNRGNDKKEMNSSKNVSKEIRKSSDLKKDLKSHELAVDQSDIKKDVSISVEKNKKDSVKSTENLKKVTTKSIENKKSTPNASPEKAIKKEIRGNTDNEAIVIVEKPKKVNKNNEKPVQGNLKQEAKKDVTVADQKKDTGAKKDVVIKPNPSITKREGLSKKESDIGLKKDIPKSVANKFKKDVPKKDEVVKKDDTVKKKNNTEKLEDEHSTPKMTQRPSRKTKEAAAIYMEILSHKLVNDSQIDDDDNISIDSFPELPNVKKTEQRENELKAQAKSTKDDTKEKFKTSDCDTDLEVKSLMVVEETNDKIPKTLKSKFAGNVPAKRNFEEKKADKQKLKKSCSESLKTENVKKDDIKNTKSDNIKHKDDVGVTKSENIKHDIKISEKIHVFPVDKVPDNIPPSKVVLQKENTPSKVKEMATLSTKIQVPSSDTKKGNLGKRKTSNEAGLTHNPHLEDEIKKSKIGKLESISKVSESKVVKKDRKAESLCKKDLKPEIADDKDVPKRQTRNSSQINKNEDSDDSDESFHVDIRVPRKKKLTRSKAPKVVKNESVNEKVEEKLDASKLETIQKPKEYLSSSDSDQSTTSDMNLQTLVNKAKNKKFSKTKSMKKTETAFSDSDEEPLSKLTNRSFEGGSQKSAIPSDKMKDKPKVEVKGNEATKPVKGKTNIKQTLKPAEVSTVPEIPKPKRECAKRPQNYLPMLSSSDEDDIFHGFDKKMEDKMTKPLPVVQPQCSHAPPLLDLLNKDIGRRFGKEKVNMSNEQIEKWLKESALAGSSIKKENDEMLKFGERIPTETTLDSVELIDTQKLKCSLLETMESSKETNEEALTVEEVVTTPIKLEKTDSTLSSQAKPQAIDRKLIFRKNKKDTGPNINAFSPENESSVYAFGEESEDLISTPFRRPSRRPSSTATSRSEDESFKHEDSLKAGHFRKPTVKQDVSKSNKDESDANIDTDESSHHFYIPQNPSKHNFSKLQSANSFNKSKSESKGLVKPGKSTDRSSELDDFKYKVPSSPSASSSSSAKLYKRQTQKQKIRPPEFISPIYLSDFPKKSEAAKLVEAPVFHPTDQEFQDPLEYIERIRHKAEQFGICRIVPPSSFKPECKVTDDMRFTAYNQYVHKMLHRWGPNFKELMAIKKYLETQNISLTHPPWIGGMEIDLPRLYQTVQTLGGLKEVIEKKKWPRVSELMKIPKSAQDRVTKLDDIYCKYLLPYDTLSPAEREKLFDEVETEWAKRESKGLMKAQQKLVTEDAGDEGDSEPDDNDIEECITKGRNMALNAFYRIARNTMSMYFKTTEPTAQEVEQEYWKHVTTRQNHICVHSGSIDSGNWGYGFAVSKNSPFARHAWNLKVLTNNSGSVLRSLGPIMGVTVPTLHVGMVFSACCWYRDPHGLPWIEYLHTGGSKIWYGIPDSNSDLFRGALNKLVPNYCRNKELWLSSDTAMVPPSVLVENRVSLCRTVQDPGQFVVVFPKAFTSSISTGYVVSESVYFAPPYWLKTARNLFDALRNSREPSIFSLDRLLLSIASDGRCNPEILRQVIPYVQELCDKEKERRVKLGKFGAMEKERMPLPEANNRKRKKLQGEEGDYECEICRMNLFISMVFDTQETVTYCLDHAIEMIEVKKSQTANCKFMFTYDDVELEGLPNKIRMAIENRLQKKVPNKYAGMPTLLTK